jgi:hypothetical protein
MSKTVLDPSDPLYVPASVSKAKKPASKDVESQNYLHEDMDEIAVGVNAASLVWLRLLQLRCMRPKDKYHLLSNKWLKRYGVDRCAKTRALAALQKRGLIRTARHNAGNIRVIITPRGKRPGAKARRRRCKNATGAMQI